MKGKHSRTMTMNAWYLVLFENVRDKNQVLHLGRQIYPGKAKNFLSAYLNAVKANWGYFVIDLSPNVDDDYRLRTNIFPGDEPTAYKLRL